MRPCSSTSLTTSARSLFNPSPCAAEGGLSLARGQHLLGVQLHLFLSNIHRVMTLTSSPCNLAHGHGSRRYRTRSFYCSVMPALDHRTARGHAPFIAARNDRDAYRQLVLNRSRSPPPSRGEDELVLRGQAAKKGQSSVIAVSVAGIHHALQRRGLELKLSVFELLIQAQSTIWLRYRFLGFNRGCSRKRRIYR